MSALLAKIGSWLLPYLLEFFYTRAARWFEEETKKNEEEHKGGQINEANLKKLEEAKTVEENLKALRDTFNGKSSD